MSPVWKVAAFVLAAACGETASAPGPGSAPGSAPERSSPAATPRAEPKAEPKAEPEAEPPAPEFDPATAVQATVEVTKLVDVPGGACGVLHIVGAIEVEVLDVGQPRPKLGLYVSCPGDLQPHGMLAVGKRLHVTLHARPKAWPRPPTRLDAALPIRYAETLALAAP